MAPKPCSPVDPKASKQTQFSQHRFAKAKDWSDCPALGPGWMRRENFRKKGITCGHSDTYYRSPSGQVLRSKVELARYLGPGWDLSGFHFKLGVLQTSSAQAAPPRNKTKRPGRRLGRPRKHPAPAPLEQPAPQGCPAEPLPAQGFETPEPGQPGETPPAKPPETPRPDPVEAPRSDVASAPQSDGSGHPRRRWRQRWLQTLGGGGGGGGGGSGGGGEVQRSDTPVEAGEQRKGAPSGEPDGRPAAGSAAAATITISAASAIAAVSAVSTAGAVSTASPISVVLPAPSSAAANCATNCATAAAAASASTSAAAAPAPSAAAAAAPAPSTAAAPSSTAAAAAASKRACGLCAGCLAQEDCGTCWICARDGKPGLVRRWRCLSRRCLQKPLQTPRGSGVRKAPGRRCRAPAPPPPARPGSPVVGADHSPRRHRRSRKCGECEACQRPQDCGECDFCLDKPKFGGTNQKRQKCRWRQCLTFAVKRLLPALKGSSPVEKPARRQYTRRKAPVGSRPFRPSWTKSKARQGLRLITEAHSERSRQKLQPVVKEEVVTDCIQQQTGLAILQENESIPGLGPSAMPEMPPASYHNAQTQYESPGLEEFGGPPELKREVKNFEPQTPGAILSPPVSFPPDLPSDETNGTDPQQSVKEEGQGEEEQVANTPVIMEIFSLSKASPASTELFGTLDSVLQEFLMELNELPLPAHWEVLPTGGPDLCLIQRSIVSTVAAAVIHIQPGLYFRVVVRDVPVPPTHELYSAHPLRLTTVDEVIELICNLEAYRLCPGWPDSWHQGQRSPGCDVLVYEGRCQYCCLNLGLWEGSSN